MDLPLDVIVLLLRCLAGAASSRLACLVLSGPCAARDVVACSRVNRRWNAASRRPEVWVAAARRPFCCDWAFRWAAFASAAIQLTPSHPPTARAWRRCWNGLPPSLCATPQAARGTTMPTGPALRADEQVPSPAGPPPFC